MAPEVKISSWRREYYSLKWKNTRSVLTCCSSAGPEFSTQTAHQSLIHLNSCSRGLDVLMWLQKALLHTTGTHNHTSTYTHAWKAFKSKWSDHLCRWKEHISTESPELQKESLFSLIKRYYCLLTYRKDLEVCLLLKWHIPSKSVYTIALNYSQA